MKRLYIKRAIAWVILVALILAIMLRYNKVLEPKYTYANSTWPTTSSYEQFYRMDKDSIDVLFFGASVAVNTFLPQVLYDEYGITSYNLGSEQQSVFLSYYWLKEALRYQKPKAIVVDTLFLSNMHPENPINTTEGLTRKCLDPMRMSPVKMHAVADLCRRDKEQTVSSYVLTNFRFHDRWESLTETDWDTDEYTRAPLYGYGINTAYGDAGYKPFEPSDSSATAAFDDAEFSYLQKMVDLCHKNGIKVLLCTIPGESMNDGMNNSLEQYADKENVRYLNMCRKDNFKKIGAKLPKENCLYHSNIWGAEKVTKFIGGVLTDDFSLQSHKDHQYDASEAFYKRVRKDCDLTQLIYLSTYLEQISDDNLCVFMTDKDINMDGIDATMKQKLTDQGFDSVNTAGAANLVFFRENGAVRENTVVSTDDGIRKGQFRDGKSSYQLSGADGSIMIDGVNYAKGSDGLNIVVYDKVLMKVVDSLNFIGNLRGKAVR